MILKHNYVGFSICFTSFVNHQLSFVIRQVRVFILNNKSKDVNFLVHQVFVCLELINQCNDDEKEYIPGENYIKGNCTQNCSWSKVRYVGHVEKCVPLCPSIPDKCSQDTIPEFYQEKIYGSKCLYRKWRCVKNMLLYLLFWSMLS